MIHENVITKLNTLNNEYINEYIPIVVLQRVRTVASWESKTQGFVAEATSNMIA